GPGHHPGAGRGGPPAGGRDPRGPGVVPRRPRRKPVRPGGGSRRRGRADARAHQRALRLRGAVATCGGGRSGGAAPRLPATAEVTATGRVHGDRRALASGTREWGGGGGAAGRRRRVGGWTGRVA